MIKRNMAKERKKVIIIGAAGRDFHNFNMLFRKNKAYEVVAFTATQIPYISDRMYPPELSGRLYPGGIKIYDESELGRLIKENGVDVCVMSYSDLPDVKVMDKASLVNAAGADFWLVAPEHTMLVSNKPVISVCGVRTGVGKSQTSRYVAKFLRNLGARVSVIRHPMPYGVLKEQIAEKFKTLKDLDKYKATIEEREDYEPHILNKFVVFAGVDYEKVLKKAEKDADVVLWDGGNNDAGFIKSDFSIAVADPLRAGNELTYYPGETVARMADLLIINKANSATKEDIDRVMEDLKQINERAPITLADSIVAVDNPGLVRGKSVVLVEDGPTITHGGMAFGAASVAAKQYGAGSVVSAKQYAVGSIKEVYDRYPNLKAELPAVGYSPKQIKDLEATINSIDCEVVLSATPTNLRRVINVNKPIVQVTYELSPRGKVLDEALKGFYEKVVKKSA
jgi:predicted GTPase